MSARYLLCSIVSTLLLFAVAPTAHAQLTALDQTRSLGTLATGTVGANQQFSDSVTNAGVYNNSESAAKDITTTDGSGDHYNAHGSADQNSLVSSTILSATGHAGTDSVMLPVDNLQSVEGRGSSQYSVDFIVPVPTPITLVGTLTATATYHLGPLEAVHTSISLSGSSAGNLYTVGGDYQAANLDPVDLDLPVSFSTTLEPGQTYTLLASATIDSMKQQSVGITALAPAASSFDFTLAAVPEPASGLFVLITLGAVGLSNRRR